MTGGYLACGQSLARFVLEPETLPVFVAWCKQERGGAEPDGFFDDVESLRADLEAFFDLLPLVEHSVGRQVMESLVAEVTR